MSLENLRPYPDALLNPLADPIFKIIFTSESPESREALRCFLSDVIGKEVTDVTLQPNELSGDCITDKQPEFDINCKVDGKCVNIELQQQNHNSEYDKRVEYHVAHLLHHFTPKGTQWNDIPQVYQISVVNFIFNPKNDNCVNRYSMRNSDGDEIAQIMNIIFVELPKIAPLSDDVGEIEKLTKVELWGKFFLNASDKNKQSLIKKLGEINRGIKMATETLSLASEEHLNWYHESRYWMHVSDELTARATAIKEGLEKGLAEGRAEEARNIAQKMIASGNIPLEQISQLTGLSKEEIEVLPKQ